MPENPNKPYDMKELISRHRYDGDFFEPQPGPRQNIPSVLPAWEARPWAS